MRTIKLVLVILFSIAIASCGDGGGDGGEVPSPTVDVTGTWNGTYSTSLISETQVTLNLTQSTATTQSLTITYADGRSEKVALAAPNVTGTYSTPDVEGTVSGTVSGNTLTFTLNQTTAECPGTFSGTATVTDNTMTFTFTGSDCLGTHNNGQGTVTKQIEAINAPTNLTATAISTTQINLSWTDNSNNEEHFMVERKTGSGGTYSQIAQVGADVTTYSDTGLSPNTTYFYRVRAHSAALGYSAYSNEASATTQGGIVISDGEFKGGTFTEVNVKDNKITGVTVDMPGTCSGMVGAGISYPDPSDGTPIINGQFTEQWHTDGLSYPFYSPSFDMTVNGTFSDNDHVGGTWNYSDANNCQMSGSWNATRTAGNSAPVANAGPDQNVSTGSLVTLNGSGSTDADGDPLTYSWSITSKPGGSGATLTGATTVNPTFTADLAGSYVISLVVNDGTVNSAADTVTVTATTVSFDGTWTGTTSQGRPMSFTVTNNAISSVTDEILIGGCTVTSTTTFGVPLPITNNQFSTSSSSLSFSGTFTSSTQSSGSLMRSVFSCGSATVSWTATK